PLYSTSGVALKSPPAVAGWTRGERWVLRCISLIHAELSHVSLLLLEMRSHGNNLAALCIRPVSHLSVFHFFPLGRIRERIGAGRAGPRAPALLLGDSPPPVLAGPSPGLDAAVAHLFALGTRGGPARRGGLQRADGGRARPYPPMALAAGHRRGAVLDWEH